MTIRDMILKQFYFSEMVIKANVAEFSHEESLISPQPSGNCLNWVLGHLAAERSAVLVALGEEPSWDAKKCARYDRHSAPIGRADAEPIDALWRAFDTGHARLLKAIAELPVERFAARAPLTPNDDPEETVASMLTTTAFHDAYHVGQTGMLRRIAGKPPADL